MFKAVVIFGATAAMGLVAAPGADARSRTVCGWYAIASCVSSEGDARAFANGGWGAVIDTDDYGGLRPGLFCVVSGPQSRSSAERDRRSAINKGVAPDVYIKRACTAAENVGD